MWQKLVLIFYHFCASGSLISKSSVLFCIFLFSFNGFPVKCLERDLWLTQGEAIFTFCSLTLAFNFWWFNSHYTHLWSDGVSIVFLLFTTFLFELKYKTINRTYGFTSIDCKLNRSEDMNGRQRAFPLVSSTFFTLKIKDKGSSEMTPMCRQHDLGSAHCLLIKDVHFSRITHRRRLVGQRAGL